MWRIVEPRWGQFLRDDSWNDGRGDILEKREELVDGGAVPQGEERLVRGWKNKLIEANKFVILFFQIIVSNDRIWFRFSPHWSRTTFLVDDGSSLSEACSTPIIGAGSRAGSSHTVIDVDDMDSGLHSGHLATRASLSSLGVSKWRICYLKILQYRCIR